MNKDNLAFFGFAAAKSIITHQRAQITATGIYFILNCTNFLPQEHT